MKPFFYKFWENIKNSFSSKNLKWHLLAILATYFIVISGFDWKYFLIFGDSRLATFLFSAVIVGSTVPVILIIVAILAFGKISKNLKIENTGYALGQAAILGLLVSYFYKFFTGRIAPPLNHLSNTILDKTPLSHISSALTDTSRIFQFGFYRGGIFWGWPSSHSIIAFGMAFTLCMLYSKNKLVWFLSILYALYIGFGVSMTIHWFSDAVAGAILGVVIGVVVGKAFQERGKSLGIA